MPTVEDATAFLVNYLQRPRPSNGYPTFGYDLFLPNVVTAYIVEVERSTDHLSTIYSGARLRQLSSFFYEAAWELARRGLLRPSVREFGGQIEGSGDGYSLTSRGREWLNDAGDGLIVLEPTRLAHAFRTLAGRLGQGFLQRASEASQCHALGLNLACCAMCGAAAESILLAVAIAKSNDESATLRTYRSAQGRRLTTNQVIGGARAELAGPFTAATGLLSYWRDDAAHGVASSISEIEAHEALSRLLRFAQFVSDHWADLIA
ncbi:hypothetical protein ACVI1L_004451 [Bradyrhizobium sp. USDA 4516]